MTRWAAFVGLTGVVVTLLLALARLSQQVVRGADAPDAETDRPGTDPGAGATNPAPHDPAIPVFEPADPSTAPQFHRQPTTESLSTGALLVNVAFTQGLFGGILAAGAIYFEVPPAAFGIGDGLPTAAAVAVGLALGVALWAASDGVGRVADAAGVGYDEQLREMLTPETTAGWVVLLGVVLPTIAVVEEFIFRGAIVGAAAVGLGASPWLLAVVASVAFGAAHGAQGRVGIAVTGGLGFVLAAAFVVTGSLLVVIVAHYLINAAEFVVHERDWLAG